MSRIDNLGTGQGMTAPKTNPKIISRIEILGRMNDRRMEARVRGDKAELLQIAAEYEALGMHRTAYGIRLEAGR